VRIFSRDRTGLHRRVLQWHIKYSRQQLPINVLFFVAVATIKDQFTVHSLEAALQELGADSATEVLVQSDFGTKKQPGFIAHAHSLLHNANSDIGLVDWMHHITPRRRRGSPGLLCLMVCWQPHLARKSIAVQENSFHWSMNPPFLPSQSSMPCESQRQGSPLPLRSRRYMLTTLHKAILGRLGKSIHKLAFDFLVQTLIMWSFVLQF
jgi:hypothetical protein